MQRIPFSSGEGFFNTGLRKNPTEKRDALTVLLKRKNYKKRGWKTMNFLDYSFLKIIMSFWCEFCAWSDDFSSNTGRQWMQWSIRGHAGLFGRQPGVFQDISTLPHTIAIKPLSIPFSSGQVFFFKKIGKQYRCLQKRCQNQHSGQKPEWAKKKKLWAIKKEGKEPKKQGEKAREIAKQPTKREI